MPMSLYQMNANGRINETLFLPIKSKEVWSSLSKVDLLKLYWWEYKLSLLEKKTWQKDAHYTVKPKIRFYINAWQWEMVK